MPIWHVSLNTYCLPREGDRNRVQGYICLFNATLELKPKTEKVLDMYMSIIDDDVVLRRAEIFLSYRDITVVVQHVYITHMRANSSVQQPREQHLPRHVKNCKSQQSGLFRQFDI